MGDDEGIEFDWVEVGAAFVVVEEFSSKMEHDGIKPHRRSVSISVIECESVMLQLLTFDWTRNLNSLLIMVQIVF